jgi:hypothetical protein
MSLLFPTNYNAALMPMPLTAYEKHMQKAANDFRKLQKVAEASDPTPRERAETIGKVLQSGMLRPGSGYLQKRAKERRFPIEHDDPEKARLNKQFGAALAQQPGHSFHPSMSGALSKIASSGVGVGVRKMVEENNQNLLPLNARLPGQQGPTISEDAIQVMNSLPDARVRQGVVNALLARPPANPNDAYRWTQSIVSIAQQVRTCCDEMGLDASALLDALSRRLDFFDPLVGQSSPARFSSPQLSVSPNIEDPASFFDVEPPEEPMKVDPQFAGADRTDRNPDFSNKSVLTKFYKVGRETGQDICKTMSQREQLEQYATIVLSDFPPELRKQILTIHDGRNRTAHAEWARIQKTPVYKSIIHAISTMKGLTDQMKGACMSLVTSRSEPPPFYLPG